MTQWIENPEGGRDRGPRAVVRAWIEVLTAPQRFFRAAVAPADQAPGLFFLMTVIFFAEGSRYLLVPAARPSISGQPVLDVLLVLALTVFFVAPLALHVLVAIQILLLRLFVSDRAGVSKTVQVLAYASAPCALAGVPVAPLRLLCGIYGSALLVIGLSEIHDAPVSRVAPAAAVPAVIGFGYGFRAIGAAREVLATSSTYVAELAGVLVYF